MKGPFFLTSALIGALRAAATQGDPARVINIGSVDGIRPPMVDSFPYGASKAGIHHLTRHLAHHLAKDHITVNAIAPGPFESKMMAFALDDPATRAGIERSVPLGRIGRPDDMAGAAIFLSSGRLLPDGRGHPRRRRDRRRLTRPHRGSSVEVAASSFATASIFGGSPITWIFVIRPAAIVSEMTQARWSSVNASTAGSSLVGWETRAEP